MNKLTKSEGIAVGVALVVVATLLFGGNIISFFKGERANPTTNNENTTMNLPSTGVQSEDIKVGEGVEAQKGDTLTVHYVGRLPDGKVFDSSVDRGQPFTFILGSGQVIRGWDEGMVGMHVGGQRKLTIAPDYGYGAQGIGPIPPNSTLIFDVELLNVSKTTVNQ